MSTETGFKKILFETAQKRGIKFFGAVDIDLAFEHGFQNHINYYSKWIDDGMHAKMDYLKRGLDRRRDVQKVFPQAQSAFVILVPYHAAPAGCIDGSSGVRYARYLRGKDYHVQMREDLEAFCKEAQKIQADTGGREPQFKICVDTSAVLERSWAYFCGLGWFGKNTMLIHPKLGSYFFIGVVFWDETTGVAPRHLSSLCGSCAACLESCPTAALTQDRRLDTHRCISYWTLENREPIDAIPEIRKRFRNWVAGCDVCQEVCPFNFKVTRNCENESNTGSAVDLYKFEDLERESDSDYEKRVKHSSLNRVKRDQFKRNLIFAKQNSESTVICKK